MTWEDEPRIEAPQVSKVKLIRNAKGDPQWEITVVPGTPPEQLDGLREQAVQQWQALTRDLFPA